MACIKEKQAHVTVYGYLEDNQTLDPRRSPAIRLRMMMRATIRKRKSCSELGLISIGCAVVGFGLLGVSRSQATTKLLLQEELAQHRHAKY